MTRRKGKIIIIEVEEPRYCMLCGKLAECRPYGPNGEDVCFECGMKDEQAVIKKFNEFMDGKEG